MIYFRESREREREREKFFSEIYHAHVMIVFLNDNSRALIIKIDVNISSSMHRAPTNPGMPASTPHSVPELLAPHPIPHSERRSSHHVQRSRRARIALPHKPQPPRDLPGPGAHIHIPFRQLW